MTAEIDIDHLAAWVGREETVKDIVAPGLGRRFRATFGDLLSADAGQAPLGLHWCLCRRPLRLTNLAPTVTPSGAASCRRHPIPTVCGPTAPLPSMSSRQPGISSTVSPA